MPRRPRSRFGRLPHVPLRGQNARPNIRGTGTVVKKPDAGTKENAQRTRISRSRSGSIAVTAIILAVFLAGWSSGSLAKPRTPIKHLIVVIGENLSFDNVFGTYIPPDPTQTVWNLLSLGIVDRDGRPGPNAALAMQMQAVDTGSYQMAPSQTGAFPYLPQPNTTLDAYPLGLARCQNCIRRWAGIRLISHGVRISAFCRMRRGCLHRAEADSPSSILLPTCRCRTAGIRPICLTAQIDCGDRAAPAALLRRSSRLLPRRGSATTRVIRRTGFS